MSEGFEKLKQIGSKKIHKDTHISLQHLNSMLNEEFSSITKVQFLGFISILEREYHLDLSDYKEHSLELFQEKSIYSSSESHLFVVVEKQRSYTALYIGIAIVIFATVAFMSINLKPLKENIFIEKNKVIKEAKKIVEKNILERELQENKNIDKIIENVKESKIIEESQKVEKVIVEEVLKEDEKVQQAKQELDIKEQKVLIFPHSKVWFGYIDLKTGKKKSLTVKSSFALTMKNSYLFMFGHGRIDLELDGKEYNYKTAKTLRLLYKDQKFTKLNVTEFKALNKGKKW